jgi:hypothetical protein
MTPRGLGIGSPMGSGRLVFLVFLLAAVAGERGAHAARLAYDAPARCPSRTRFADEVTARLGFSPWSETGATLHVTISADRATFVGSLAPDAAAAPRRFTAASCRKVADLLVTAAATALDRREPPAAPAVAPAEAAPKPGAKAASKPAATKAPAKKAPAKKAPAKKVAAAEPAAPSTGSAGGLPTHDELPPAAQQWSFAERNNSWQLGGIFVTAAGFGITGRVPLGPGHLQISGARRSDDSDFGESVTNHVHAYYLYPVFYINRDSAFEVPIYAGGGLGYQSESFDQTMGTDASESAVMPTLAIANALQFRAFPVEFLFEMSVMLVEPPVVGGRVGFNFAIKYVFGR